MSGVSKIDIRESIETLKALLGQQKSAERFQRVQVLYLLKSEQAQTIKQAANLVGKNRVTVQAWLHCYQEGGLGALLSEKAERGRKSSIPEEIIEILTEKLQKSHSFATYREIQAWLEKDLGIKVSYDVVYYLVHDKLKIYLKRARRKE